MTSDTLPNPGATDPSSLSWRRLINQVESRADLSAEEADWAMRQMMGGEGNPLQIAGFLVGLHTKGETAQEIQGMAQAMLDLATPYAGSSDAVDIVGTGGDQLNTVNISTMASLVMAGAGATVVKHGNRASTSATGSADALERLGVPLDAPADLVERAAEEVGITFLFANQYHPAMKEIAPIRKALQARTAFNYLGPLANPGRVRASVIGVSHAGMAPIMADVLAGRGNHALTFTGPRNIDELTLIGPTQIWEAHGGEVRHTVLDPADIDLPTNSLEELQGRDAAHNAQVILKVLEGETGAIRNTVLLNAAAGLTVLEEDVEEPLPERLKRNILRAQESVDSGSARNVLTRWIDFLSQG